MRAMRCSPHTVYRAKRKRDEGDLKDTSHKPKSGHPRHLKDEKENDHRVPQGDQIDLPPLIVPLSKLESTE